MGLLLCLLAFALSCLLGARSVGAGMAFVLAVGYSYGMVRAVVFDGFSYFVFDAAVLGFYLARLPHLEHLAARSEARSFYIWAGVLIGWPFLVLAIGIASPVH